MADGQVTIQISLNKDGVKSDADAVNGILKDIGKDAGGQMDKQFKANADGMAKTADADFAKVQAAFEGAFIDKNGRWHDAESHFISLKNQAAKLGMSVDELKGHLDRLAKDTVKPKISADNSEAKQKINETDDKLKNAAKTRTAKLKVKDENVTSTLDRLQSKAETTQHIFGKIFGAALLANAASSAISGVVGMIKEAASAGMEYSKEQQVMLAAWTTLTGSASKGQDLVDMVMKLANATGQSADLTNELAQGFYHLHSNKQEAEDMTHAMLNMGDAVGLTSDQLKTVGLDMVHALSSGKLDVGSLNQLSDYFPMFSEKMADYYHVSVGTLRKMVSAGKVSAADTEKVFEQLGNVQYGKAADNMLGTLTGMQRVIEARTPQLVASFEKPFMSTQNNVFGSISKWMQSSSATKDFQQLGDAASHAMGLIADGFKKAFGGDSLNGAQLEHKMINALSDDIVSIGRAIGNFVVYLGEHQKDIGKFFGDIKSTGVTALKLLVPTLGDAAKAMKPLIDLALAHPAAFAALASSALIANKGLGALGKTMKGFKTTKDVFKGIREGAQHAGDKVAIFRDKIGLLNRTKSAFKWTADLVTSGVTKGLSGIKFAGKKTGAAFKWTGKIALNGAKAAISGIGTAAKASGKAIASMTSAALDFGKTGVMWVAQKVKILAVAAAQKVASAATKVWSGIQKAFNIVMNMNPIGLIVTAVGLLIIGFVELYQHCKPFRDFMNGLGRDIKKVFSGIGKWFVKQWDGVTKWFSNTGKTISKWGSDVGKSFSNMATNTKKTVTSWGKDIKKGYDNANNWAIKSTQDMVNQVSNKHSWLNQHTNGAALTMFTGLKKTYGAGHKVLQDSTKTFGDFVHGRWDKLGQDVGNSSKDMMTAAHDLFKTGYDTLNKLTGGWLDKTVKWFEDLPGKIGKALHDGWKAVEQGAIDMGNGMLDGIGKGVNGVIGGIDWVLGKVGVSKKDQIQPWKVPQFATGGKALGLSVVGEAGKPELIKHSNGDMEMSPATATLYNFVDPVDILGGDATEQLLNSLMPQYSLGTWIGSAMDFVKGGWNAISSGAEGFWNAITHPEQLLNTAIDKFTDLSGLNPFNAKMAGASVKKMAFSAVNFIKKELMSDASNPAGANIDRWRPFIARAAGMSGVNLTVSGMDAVLRRIKKESGGNPTIVQQISDINSRAGHPAQGLLQYVPSTFASWARPGHTRITSGLDQLLAMFNDSNWLSDISAPGGWGPTGHRRFAAGTTSDSRKFIPEKLRRQVSQFVQSISGAAPVNLQPIAVSGGHSTTIVQSPGQSSGSGQTVQFTVVTQYDSREVARMTSDPIDIRHNNRIVLRQAMHGRNNA